MDPRKRKISVAPFYAEKYNKWHNIWQFHQMICYDILYMDIPGKVADCDFSYRVLQHNISLSPLA